MNQRTAITGSVVHFLLAPALVAGVIPFYLTSWRFEQYSIAAIIAGGIPIAAGTLVLLACFWLFVRDGRGTPAPIAPTERLVVRGPYRCVRNPMYLSVIGIIAGQAVIFWQINLLLYGAGAGLVMATFARVYEEPSLCAAFGTEYDEYRLHVPAWLPRWQAWHGASRGR